MAKPYLSMNPTLFSGKKFNIILHIAIWIILFVLPTYLLYIDSDNDKSFLYRSYAQVFLYAIIFYANYLWLSPHLFLKQKKVLYFIAALSLLTCTTVINNLVFNRFDAIHPRVEKLMQPGFQQPPGFPYMPNNFRVENHKRPSKDWPIYNFVITTLFLSGFGMGLSFSDKLRLHERQRKEAEKEKLNTELAFLKNQINPHFFFNTLNNIYALVQTDVADGQKAILQLSKLMRYMIYETEKGDRLLSQEIDFMSTYIELMKLRISDKVSFTIDFPVEYTDISLPPLLFLPFIENAFKHGISYRNVSYINVMLKAEPGTITFKCSNSLANQPDIPLRAETGIGLMNVKKRLALLFPDHHTLKIEETEDSFNVDLQIDIL